MKIIVRKNSLFGIKRLPIFVIIFASSPSKVVMDEISQTKKHDKKLRRGVESTKDIGLESGLSDPLFFSEASNSSFLA